MSDSEPDFGDSGDESDDFGGATFSATPSDDDVNDFEDSDDDMGSKKKKKPAAKAKDKAPKKAAAPKPKVDKPAGTKKRAAGAAAPSMATETPSAVAPAATPAKKAKVGPSPPASRGLDGVTPMKPAAARPTEDAASAAKAKVAAPAGKPVGSEKDATTIILDYMNKQNKPYSVINIHDNLHGIIKRPLCQKILDTLAEKGLIKEKTYGKVKLYFPDQAQYGEVTPAEVAALDDELKAAEAVAKDAMSRKQALETRVKTLNAALTDEELADRLVSVEKKVKEQREELLRLQTTITAPVSPQARENLQKAIAKYKKVWQDRRRKVYDFLDMACGEEGSIKQLEKMSGIETDADAGVDLKTFA